MSVCRNGVEKISQKKTFTIHSFAEEEDLKIKAKFQGFEKEPSVVIHRIDITPYLNRTKKNPSLSLIKTTNSEKITRYLTECEFTLNSDDLEQLKHLLSKGYSYLSPLKMGPDSDTGSIRCKICEKVYGSEKKLQNHEKNKHMLVYRPENGKAKKRVSFSETIIVHEVKEYHKCRKCTKIFEDYKLLKRHMKLKHKKRNCYICYYCEKKFVDRMFFKVHIKQHCEVCGELLPSKTKCLQHKRNICRVIKKYKCKTCGDVYFNFMDLKDHSYDHTNSCYLCDVCKDQCPSKCALGHHISFLHSKKRPTSLYEMRNLGSERLYLCNFCEASSVDRHFIESHVQLLADLNNRAMTGYKDYYFCDHCLQIFDTESDMLQHKWTHFLKTSDNSQVRPKSILANENKSTKTHYKLDEIPDSFKPKVVLERIKVGGKELKEDLPFVNVDTFDVHNGEIKSPVVDKKSKKTIVSKYQCQNCNKYYSSNYTLMRHIETQHSDYENLRCKVCEETFFWPSLLKSHKCIRLNLPEMPFQDARPEIHFDNVHQIPAIDELNLTESECYENRVDFEIPAPAMNIGEYVPNSFNNRVEMPLQSLGYKLVMQEVPIEF